MAKERWLPVVGFEGFYEISDCGRVRGVERTLCDGRQWKSIVLRQKTAVRGHKAVQLSKSCRRRTVFVHTLMLEAFVGPRPHGQEGAHDDGAPDHNTIKNLRWDTPKGNTADRYRHGTILFGERNVLAKLSPENIGQIFAMRRRGMIYREIGNVFGVTAANICSILLGKTWAHLGNSL